MGYGNFGNRPGYPGKRKGYDMTDYIGWTPPPGAVVEPPVHPKTVVHVIFSDGSQWDAGYHACDLNWSAEGDGPSIVAYAVVEEYKPAPEPREWWMLRVNDVMIGAWRHENHTKTIAREYTSPEIIHIREVLPAAREVVAWAVVCSDSFDCFYEKRWADGLARQNGGTVVRLTGVMSNE